MSIIKKIDLSPSDQHMLLRAKLALVFRHSVAVLLTYTLILPLFYLIFDGYVDSTELASWLVAMTLAIAYRVWLLLRFHYAEERHSLAFWKYSLIISAAITGGLWGVTGYLFFVQESQIHQTILIVILMGLGAGAATFMSTLLTAYYLFLVFIVTPVIVNLFLQPNEIYSYLGVMSTLFTIAFIVFGRNLNKIMEETLLLRSSHVALVDNYRYQKEAAEKANIAKSKFLAAASHDLRQPLHALTLYAGALDERIRFPEVKDIVERISASVAALENLFNALLDISKLDSGMLNVNKNAFLLSATLDRLENDCIPQAREKGIDFAISGCTNAVVYSDADFLERILRNLLINAIRYTDRGAVSLHCEEMDNGRIRLVIKDTGKGIPSDKQAEIFDEYVQLENHERDRGKGLGLGLAIVARLVDLLDHTLLLDSTPGQGTTFSLILPSGDPDAIVMPEPEQLIDPEQKLQQIKALLIDDEQDAREAGEILLKGWHCQVQTASNLMAALELLDGGYKPNVMLSDFRLQEGQTGLEAITQVRQRLQQDIPAMIITGDLEVAQRQDIQQSSCRVLQKPIKPARLRAFLKFIVDQLEKDASRQ